MAKEEKGITIDVSGEAVLIPPPDEVQRLFVKCLCNKRTLALSLHMASANQLVHFVEEHPEYKDAVDIEKNKMELQCFRKQVYFDGLIKAAQDRERWALEKLGNDFLRDEGVGSFEMELARIKAAARAQAAENAAGAMRDLVAEFKRPAAPPAEADAGEEPPAGA